MFFSFLQLIRFPNAFTAASNVIVGYAVLLEVGQVEPRWLDLSLACLGAMMLYAFGMALNDIADHRVDEELHPERPIPSGRISLKTARIGAAVLLLGGVTLLGVANPVLVLLALLLGIAIGLYDIVLKRRQSQRAWPWGRAVLCASCWALS